MSVMTFLRNLNLDNWINDRRMERYYRQRQQTLSPTFNGSRQLTIDFWENVWLTNHRIDELNRHAKLYKMLYHVNVYETQVIKEEPEMDMGKVLELWRVMETRKTLESSIVKLILENISN